MHSNQFIITRDGSKYNKAYYRLKGNILQVRYTALEGTRETLFPIVRWRDIRVVEL